MKLIVFLSLVLCLSAVAQPNPINRRAMAISGLASIGIIDIPTSIGLTVTSRWMAVHFATNAVGITAWPDETNQFYWNLLGASSSLTNSPLGVYLDNTHCMVGSNQINTASSLTCWIFVGSDKNKCGAGAADPYGTVVQDATRGIGGGFSTSGFFGGSCQDIECYFGDTAAGSIKLGTMATNVLNCVVLGGFPGVHSYTNGVDTGLTDANGAVNIVTPRIGAQNFGAGQGGLFGYLKEVIVFKETNATTSQASNLNYYMTHYPY